MKTTDSPTLEKRREKTELERRMPYLKKDKGIGTEKDDGRLTFQGIRSVAS